MPDGRPRLGDLLVDLGFIDESHLEVALAHQRRHGGRLGKILVDSAVITEDRLVHALSRQLGIDSCDPVMTPIHPKVLALIPNSVAYRHRVLSLARKRDGDREVIYVAMADPLDTEAMEAVRQQVGPNVRLHWMLAGESELELALEKHLGPADFSADPAPAAASASTYQGRPVVQGLPLRRDLPPRRQSTGVPPPRPAPSAVAAPPVPAPAPALSPFQSGPADRFPPLAPGEELSGPGALDDAFEGAFAEGPEVEIPSEALLELDFEDDDAPGLRAGPPRMATADLEVLPETPDDDLEPIPLDQFSAPPPDVSDRPEPGLETLEGDAIEELPHDAEDEPDGISEPYAERPPEVLELSNADALPALGPYPSEALSDFGAAELEDASPRAEAGAAPPSGAPVGDDARLASWGDLLPVRRRGASSSEAEAPEGVGPEAATPPPELEMLSEAELEPLDDADVEDAEVFGDFEVAEATEPPDALLEPRAVVDAGPPSLLEPEVEVNAGFDPEASGAEGFDPLVEREPTMPLARVGEAADESPWAAAGSVTASDDPASDVPISEDEAAPASSEARTADMASEASTADPAVEAEEPSPWSDHSTTASLDIALADDAAPASDLGNDAPVDLPVEVDDTPDLAPEAAAASEVERTADVSAQSVTEDTPAAPDPADDAPSADRPDGAALRSHLDRFLAGDARGPEAEWWTRVLLEVLRDADVLTEERIARAAAALAADDRVPPSARPAPAPAAATGAEGVEGAE